MPVTFTSLRHVYFAYRPPGKWRWEVWWNYEDGHADEHSGAHQWRAAWGFRFWRWLNAARLAQDLQLAHDEGWFIRSEEVE